MTQQRNRRLGVNQQLADQYTAWRVHECQARFRGEDYSLDFEDFVSIWANMWNQRGRKSYSCIMTRWDLDKGWSRDNTIIMERLQHQRRVGERIRLKNRG